MTRESLIWALFGFCLVLSFILSGMEAGVFALSRLRVRRQMHAGRTSAKALHNYLENPENFLWTILVGNTVANFIILGWIIAELHEVLRQQRIWFVLVFSVIVFLFYALFDLLPKMLFRMYPNRLCVALARPFGLIHFILRPLVSLVEYFSGLALKWRGGKVFTGHLFGNREELRLVMQESAQGLSSEERAMINRVLDLQTLTVRQTMKPFELAATVTAETPLAEAVRICRERKLTRLPIWETREGRKRVAGILNLNLLMYEAEMDTGKKVGDYTREALFLNEDMRLEDAMRRMQRSGQRLAIVLARDRHELGIITLQDVLKVIFGEMSL